MIKLGVTLLSLASLAGGAAAAPMKFDCDVPADHFSQISAPIDAGGVVISGQIVYVERRTGSFIPLAAASVQSTDKANRVTLQILPQGFPAKTYDVQLRVKGRGEPKQVSLGEISSDGEPISFSLSLSPAGDLIAKVGDKGVQIKTMPIVMGDAVVSCSTGQFKFTNLVFTNVSPGTDQSTP